ncbi:MAG: calcium-binding protein, partial [Kordiimonas sp.]
MPTFTPSSEFAINSTTEESQEYSALAALENGGFVAVWDHGVIDGSGTAIQMLGIQRFNEKGEKVGAEILRPMSEQQKVGGFADVAALKGGGFVVTWRTDNAADDFHEEIAAQVFNENGTTKGDQFIVNSVTDYEQIHAEVAADDNGGFMIVWQTTVLVGSDTDISAQIFDANGNPVGDEIKVNTTTEGEQEAAQVMALSNGNYIVVWEDTNPSNFAVRAQIVSPTGQLVGDERLINQPSSGNSIDPSVAAFEGGFVVAWGATGSFDQEVRAQLFNNDGTERDASFQVNTHTKSYQSTPTVVALKDGGFVVTYTSSGDFDGEGHGIAGQQFDVSGNKVGDEFVVNETTAGNQLSSTSVALNSGGFAVAWDTPDPSGGFFEFDINGRVFTAADTSVDPSGPQRLIGGEGADKLTGADENDLLMGNGGTDNLTGAGGDDILLGGEGADVLKGNAGQDVMFAGAGDDLIWAGSGDDAGDTIVGGAGNDKSGGGAGDDFMVGGGGAEGSGKQLTTYTESAADDGSDTLYGAEGNDTILGGGWDDSKVSDNGKFDVGEQVTSGTEGNELWAGSGDDLIYGA